MRKTILSFGLSIGCLAVALTTAVAVPPFIGVFSSPGDNFSGKTIMLADDGKGLFCGGGGCDPLIWKPGITNGDLVITLPEGDYHKGTSLSLHYDSDQKEIFVIGKKAFGEDAGPFFFVTNKIPNAEKMHKELRFFDGSRESLEPVGAIFAFSVTNHMEDLISLQNTIEAGDVPCNLAGQAPFVLVYLRDFDRAREIGTNKISLGSLSVKVRCNKNTGDLEVWDKGKKTGIEPFSGTGVFNTIVPIHLK